MTMGADVAELPPLSVATTWTWYAAAGSEPVIHVTSPTHVGVLHGTVAKTPRLPQNLRLFSGSPLEAVAVISMLPPVHVPVVGAVMLTVGAPPPAETVTDTLALAVWPEPSVTVRSRVWAPLGTALVFQEKLAVVTFPGRDNCWLDAPSWR